MNPSSLFITVFKINQHEFVNKTKYCHLENTYINMLMWNMWNMWNMCILIMLYILGNQMFWKDAERK